MPRVAAVKSQRRSLNADQRERVNRIGQRQRRRQILMMSLSVLAVISVVLTHVWLRLQVVHMGYVLSTTSKLQNQLEQEHRELKVELATVTSPERLEAMARQRLGLIYPEKGQVLILP